MNQDIKSNLYPCAHCSQSGTCSSGEEGHSCYVCIGENELKGKSYVGIVCGVCNGIGLVEPKTERINKRIEPILAIFIIYSLLLGVYISALLNSQYFSEILAFSGTLLGSIVTYYFSNKTRE